jgi:hypothetical protein
MPRHNPPLNRLRQLGPNMTEVQHGEVTVLYSYQTPVAVFAPGIGYLRTDHKWSVTTSKHINKWLDGATAKKVPQATIAHLAQFADNEDVHVAEEGARNPPQMYKYPGRYEGELDITQYLDTLIGEWGVETIGGLYEGPGWAASALPIDAEVIQAIAEMAKAHGEPITRGDYAFLRQQRGVILHYSDQGFVSADFYKSKRAFEEAAAALETEAQEWWDEEGED